MTGARRIEFGELRSTVVGREATISAELAGIFDRLGSSAESWRARLEKLRTRGLFGRFFAASREKLRAAAVRLNVRRVRNLAGCPSL
jgi:hypothetical protein